ncbi:MAG: type I restriction enzyme HsdR N-terminal domain-containing protein [Saprospiraceae bacterium]|nr:type I restriction enzyme HsdR N-terminal domain-containing protein [Saprospiraceae bacterium]
MPVVFDLYSYAGQLLFRVKDKQAHILDFSRKSYVKATPEEIVRQSLIKRLNQEFKIPLSRIRTEYELVVNRMTKRLDILIYDREGKPWMIIETKAPSVRLSQETIDQVVLYNNVIFAPWLMITNGSEAVIASVNFKTKKAIEVFEFPSL